MNRRSEYYLKGELHQEMTGDEENTYFERYLRVSGNDQGHVDGSTPWIKGKVMP